MLATSVVLNTELSAKPCSPGDKEWITHAAQGWAPLGRQGAFLCPHYSALGFLWVLWLYGIIRGVFSVHSVNNNMKTVIFLQHEMRCMHCIPWAILWLWKDSETSGRVLEDFASWEQLYCLLITDKFASLY